MASEKREILCAFEGRRRVVSFIGNDDVQKENEELLKAAKTAFSDLLSKDSGSNYYLQVKTVNEGVLKYNLIHIMYIICRLRTRSMD